MFSKILIAHDGSDGANKALANAIRLAKENDAALHMISIEEVPYAPATISEVVEEKGEEEHRFAKLIARAKSLADLQAVKLHPHIVTGHPVRDIVAMIEQQRFDLLVIGFMGHSALYGRIIGSTTEKLVRLAPCSVMVVK